ncbi:MAG: PHP domain-containing protein [Eubacteriales bacterium]|nr:PHP domain-containing protein [Clostridiales bacterium]MDD2440633.1 PHP domain-containing protein [Eubacteriales bacterium]MDD4139431.1 PHP domain-containing protein [Eubacteriales bacterium]MDD4743596.1 PHP domain-containing protein [Eubacteriales bacterium]
MKCFYDLHIHSALSPCAEKDMTPQNIVAMARLKGLGAIAVTDHQSSANCAAVMEASRDLAGPVVIPGLEIESSEEIHLLCLLPGLHEAQQMQRVVRAALPARLNRPDIFGTQLLLDRHDRITGEETCLLLQACSLDCQTLALQVRNLGGVLIPAHVDRDAYSMLQTLGAIPADFPTAWLEFTSPDAARDCLGRHPALAAYRPLYNSDAHRLGDIAEARFCLDLPDSAGFGGAGCRHAILQALQPC